jgi:hypothetical protein
MTCKKEEIFLRTKRILALTAAPIVFSLLIFNVMSSSNYAYAEYYYMQASLGKNPTSCFATPAPNSDLSNCDLTGIDLSFANLAGINLSGANLQGARLYGTHLEGANLQGANISAMPIFQVRT